MRKTRTCTAGVLRTGGSACPIDFGKVKGALLVKHGVKLPASLTAEELEAACHADAPNRVFPIATFVEFTKEGGEPQTNAVGYGGTGVTGLSPRVDTFTLDRVNEVLNASLLECKNAKFDAYFFDENGVIYGMNDGTDTLAGIPMSTVYSTMTEHPTSGDLATQTVSFCYADVEKYEKKIDFQDEDFNLEDAVMGLTPVQLVEAEQGKFKILEKVGGYDRTAEFGADIASNAVSVLDGATSATYSSETELITIVASENAVPGLKAPSALYAKSIKGIEYTGTKSL